MSRVFCLKKLEIWPAQSFHVIFLIFCSICPKPVPEVGWVSQLPFWYASLLAASNRCGDMHIRSTCIYHRKVWRKNIYLQPSLWGAYCIFIETIPYDCLYNTPEKPKKMSLDKRNVFVDIKNMILYQLTISIIGNFYLSCDAIFLRTCDKIIQLIPARIHPDF